MTFLKKSWPWLAALLSGLLLVLSFPPFGQGWLVWVALTPLIAALWFGGGGLRRGAALGYVAGLVFFWGVFPWLIQVTVAGWFLMPFYLALIFALWGWFAALAVRGAGDFTFSGANIALAFSGAAGWTFLEWLRGVGALSFGWNGLGVALQGAAWLPVVQLAEFTGTAGLSFLVAFTNLMLVITVVRFVGELRIGRVRPHWDFSLNMALIAAALAFGFRVLTLPAPTDTTPLRIAAVQPNIPQSEKFDPTRRAMVLERFTRLTEAALVTQPQLLLWPEAATPGFLYEEEIYKYVTAVAKKGPPGGGFNFLLGSLDEDAAKGECHNVAALFTQHGETVQVYRKMHLVPFGEYIPFRQSFPPFEWLLGGLVPEDFAAGREPTLLRLEAPEMDAAALICFEDTLGRLARRFVKGRETEVQRRLDNGEVVTETVAEPGAQLLVNLTNDAWFWSVGARQHLANARLRAVENRRPLVRCTNTGVTAVIDPLGRVTPFAPDGNPHGEGVFTATVDVPPEDAPLTLYTRWGDWFPGLCALASFLSLVLWFWRRQHIAGSYNPAITAAQRTGEVVISIHDVAPRTHESIGRIMAELENIDVKKVALLVVPDYHHTGHILDHPEFCRWLHDRVGCGDEVVIHGYYHLRSARRGETFRSKMTTQYYTAGEGEFFDISGAEALGRISMARQEFRQAGFEPHGFIPPAWLMSPGAEQAARHLQVEYTTTLGGIFDYTTDTEYPSQSLVWSTRSLWRRVLSRFWNANLYARQRKNPLVRISIHPADLEHPAVWKQIKRLVARAIHERTETTYWEYLEKQHAAKRDGEAASW